MPKLGSPDRFALGSGIAVGALAICSALLTGCNSQAETLEANYSRTVEATGTIRERCSAQRELAALYSKEGNEQKYSDWKSRAAMTCLEASLAR